MFPDAKLFAAKNDPKCVSPIYATSARGDALLLPLRVSAKEEAAERAAALREAIKAAECNPRNTQRENTLSLSAFARIAAAMPA